MIFAFFACIFAFFAFDHIACDNDVFYFLSFYKLKEQYARSFHEIRYSLCQLSRPKEKEEHDREKKGPCASKKSISRQKNIYLKRVKHYCKLYLN